MEPLTLFAGSVGLVAVIHLLSTTIEHFGKEKYATGNSQVKRDDWYCFFKMSDLLGENWNITETRKSQPTRVDVKRREQARRQQANRPRIQA